MGGGVSTSTKSATSPSGRSITPAEIAVHRRQMMDMVENFVVNVYASCPRIEAMWLILSSKLGQKAFEGFVKAEYSDEYLQLFILISQVLAAKVLRVEDLSNHVERVKAKLLSPIVSNGIPVLLRNEFFYGEEISVMSGGDDHPFDETAETEKSRLLTLFERLQNEVVTIMARDYYNGFIVSKFYKNWRAAESSHAVATTVEDTTASQSIPILSAFSGEISFRGSISIAAKNTPSSKLRNRMRKILQPKDLSISAFSGLFSSAKEEVLQSRDSWLTALLAAVEALPVCFSLATAKKRHEGFPLIYVNKYFERLTGFTRREILGLNVKDFLQCVETETHKVAVLNKGLGAMTTCVSVVTNKTKDGRLFKNLVALKPVLDSQRKFAYVIGLHYDVTSELQGVGDKISLAEELLEMLPASIITDEDHLQLPEL